jgi:2-dehydro-3-deoxygluconokinase
MPDIISLGEPMFELNASDVGALDEVTSFESGWGGDTSNFAIAAARLGSSVGMMGRIGSDSFGRSFLNKWKEEGIDTSRVIVQPDSFTAVYFISRQKEGGHDFTYYRKGSAASQCSPEDIDPDYIAGAKVFHSSGIAQAISKSSCDAVFKAVEIAKANGVLFSYDPNLRLKLWSLPRARAVINYSFELADIVLPSLDDAKVITGLDKPEDIVQSILARGPKIVALKLGSEGCLVADGKEMFFVKPMKIDPVDTSGSGDAFDGAFITGILEGWDLRYKAKFANVVGALTATGKGCVTPLPTREDVLRHLADED